MKSYHPDQLRILFVHAGNEDMVLFHFFLSSGLRDAEVVFSCWSDVDFRAKTLDVKEKSDFPQFEVKDHEERAVPLPDALIELLRERRKKYPTTRLIFPGEKKGSHLGSKQKSRKISRRRYSRHGRRSGISHLHGHTSDLSNNLP